MDEELRTAARFLRGLPPTEAVAWICEALGWRQAGMAGENVVLTWAKEISPTTLPDDFDAKAAKAITEILKEQREKEAKKQEALRLAREEAFAKERLKVHVQAFLTDIKRLIANGRVDHTMSYTTRAERNLVTVEMKARGFKVMPFDNTSGTYSVQVSW